MAKKRSKTRKIGNLNSLESNKNQEKLEKINKLVGELETETGKEFSEILGFLKEKRNIKENFFPSTIFNKKLGATECLVKYMKEEQGKNYKEISEIIKRSRAVVGIIYRNSLKKNPARLIMQKKDQKVYRKKSKSYTTTQEAETYLPFSIFSSKYTIFESIIKYLKEKESLRFSHIARLTSRDPRTIWTIYNRLKRKNEK